MSAVLRAQGRDFAPDRFCSESLLEPCAIFRRGEPSRTRGVRETSGINLALSDAGFDEFTRQAEEATTFLEAHKEDLLRLRNYPGLESMNLDFGIASRDVYVQNDYFPPSLIRLAGELGPGTGL